MRIRKKPRYHATFHCTHTETLHARTRDSLTADSLPFVFLLQEHPTQKDKLKT